MLGLLGMFLLPLTPIFWLVIALCGLHMRPTRPAWARFVAQDYISDIIDYWELVPMCHPIALTGADVSFSLVDAPRSANAATPARCGVAIEVTCRCTGETGVEMEALCGGVAAVAQDYISDIIDYLKRRITEKYQGKGPYFWLISTSRRCRSTLPRWRRRSCSTIHPSNESI